MAAILVFNPDADDQRPLTEVRVTKLKECPMLTKGRMDNHIFQQWTIACQQFQKHLGKKNSEIVSFVADDMLEPQFVTWYHANQSRINSILGSYQGNTAFADWVVVLQNLNAWLENMRLEHTLSDTSLKAHLESHMRPDLRWKLDKELAKEWAKTQAIIDVSNVEQTSKRKPLIDRLFEPPSHTLSTLSAVSETTVPCLKLAKLTDKEKKLLAEHQGCTHCCTFDCDHPETPDICPMKTTNSWPDPKTTKVLTLAMALAAKSKSVAGLTYVGPIDEEEVRDEDTDESYTYAITSSLSDPLPFQRPT
ncbi:hypothetical protein C0993_008672 [Termitomyces sp. T159_Od127]|nr:hypothetical protein C0993_008672 [Termitomyces sp. T159_Od127]